MLKAIDDAIDTDTEGRRIGPDKFTIRSQISTEKLSPTTKEPSSTNFLPQPLRTSVMKVSIFWPQSMSSSPQMHRSTANSQSPLPLLVHKVLKTLQSPESSLDASSAIDPIADAPPRPAVELPPPAVTPAPEPVIIHDEPKPSPASAAIAAIVGKDGTRHPIGDTRLENGPINRQQRSNC